MAKHPKTATVKQQQKIEQQIRNFEKENPGIAKSLELFEMSMQEYDKAVQSLSSTKIYTSNSTIAKQI